MRVISHRIPYRIGWKHRLVVFSDVHYGAKLCAEKHFKEMIARHANEHNTFFGVGGDLYDAVIPNGGQDKRMKASMTKPEHAILDAPVDAAIREMAEMLQPIKERILWWNDGNHELKYLSMHGSDLTQRTMKALWGEEWKTAHDRIRLGYAGFIVLRFCWDGATLEGSRTRTLTSVSIHGVGGSSKTEGGHITSIGTNSKSYRADIFFFGHNHRLGTWDNTVITPNGPATKITSIRETRCNTGTFLKNLDDGWHTSYSEQAQYRPNELGYCIVDLEHTRNGVEITAYKRVFH